MAKKKNIPLGTGWPSHILLESLLPTIYSRICLVVGSLFYLLHCKNDEKCLFFSKCMIQNALVAQKFYHFLPFEIAKHNSKIITFTINFSKNLTLTHLHTME